MILSKLPIWAKALLGIAVIGGAFMLFLGYTNYKAVQAFKPYRNLAVELSNRLGGGFSLLETHPNKCKLNESACPSIKMYKSGLGIDVVKASSLKSKLTDDFKGRGFVISNDLGCAITENKIDHCGALAEDSKNKLSVLYSLGTDQISVDIYKQ